MKTLNLTVMQWPLIASLTLIAAVVAFGAGHRKVKTVQAVPAKATHKKVSSPAVSAPAPENARLSFAHPLGPQAMAEERAAYAPSDAFRKQAEADYQSGDLAGAEAACFQAFSAAPVIQGQKQQPPFVDLLLGRIYLKGGQYAKAIQWLQGAKLHTVTSGLNLDLALAYARLGDYKNASRFYSDQASLQYHFAGKDVLPQDLPGTDTPQALEASILLARGLDVYLEHRDDEALVEFQAAHRLAPDNALIAYYCAYILSEEGRHSEAAPLFQRAADTGRGAIAKEAKSRAANEIRRPLIWAPKQ